MNTMTTETSGIESVDITVHPVDSRTIAIAVAIRHAKGLTRRVVTRLVPGLGLGAQVRPASRTSQALTITSSLGLRGFTLTQLVVSVLAEAKLSEFGFWGMLGLVVSFISVLVLGAYLLSAVISSIHRSSAKSDNKAMLESLYTALASLASWIGETPIPKERIATAKANSLASIKRDSKSQARLARALGLRAQAKSMLP